VVLPPTPPPAPVLVCRACASSVARILTCWGISGGRCILAKGGIGSGCGGSGPWLVASQGDTASDDCSWKNGCLDPAC
jgi:hypothetical protein